MMPSQEIMVNGKIPVQWDGQIAACKKCGASIGFGVTKNGKHMPFDVSDPKHTSHFGTCPYAGEFRRMKKPSSGE